MELRDKTVLIVGLAQTGIAVAKFAASRGARVIVNDSRSEATLGDRVSALAGCADLELGGHNLETFTNADLVVMSPGVPELPEMRAAREAGVEVIAEIELAARCFHPGATLIAITGTNGKSTTTALTGAICEASGRPTFCGGNLGNHPLIEAVDHTANCDGGLIVAEVAGFMLETCVDFRPKIGACLNITEDHLDRYGTMEVYADMKKRIFRRQLPGDYAIANANDEETVAGVRASQAQILFFDSQNSVERGACLSQDRSEIILRIGAERRFPVSDLPIFGNHNLENAMVAYLAAHLAGVSDDAIRKGARSFVSQKHRMERVCEVNGVTFFDDSKGTNVAAVAASVRGFPMPLWLIAGGIDKGGSYQPMFDALRDVCRGIILIGEATAKIEAASQAAGVAYPVLRAETLHEAVCLAFERAASGEAVVLSPACSSYDMFKNFEERGMAFREAANALRPSL